MWGNWINSAQLESPNEDFLAASFSDGRGFFAAGVREDFSGREWGALPKDLPIVGGRSFFGSEWGEWRKEEFFSPRAFVFFDGKKQIALPEQLQSPPMPESRKKFKIGIAKKEFHPIKQEWRKICERIQAGIDCGDWSKVVPARSIRYELATDSKFELCALWERLNSEAPPNSHRFLWKKGGEIFFGASPELLFTVSGNRIWSQAVAGTAVVGQEEALFSDKIQREHSLVVEDIVARFTEFAPRPEIGARNILRYGKISHLCTPIVGDCSTSSAHQLAYGALNALHPTPAVGGLPSKVAVDFLQTNETMERGYFAGPIGFSFNGDACFLVGIRSAKITTKYVEVFAGAGFVRGSTAEGEWEETELKLKTMEGVLGLEPENEF